MHSTTYTTFVYKSMNEVKCDLGKMVVYKERKGFVRIALT
jgi:hypothetical protein